MQTWESVDTRASGGALRRENGSATPSARRGAASGPSVEGHTIMRGPNGVLHVTGGKLTTYREMASQVVEQLAGPEANLERTATIPLPGGDRPVEDVRSEAGEVIADDVVRDRLVFAYGTRWREVWDLGDERPELRQRLDPAHAVIGAEVVHGVANEMATSLGDVLIRRTHLAFESSDHARGVAPAVVALVAPLFGWSDGDRTKGLAAYADEVRRTFELEG